MLLVVSPILVPLAVTGAHIIGNWRRKLEQFRPVINPEHHAVA
jgi:hypothetical protein